MSAGTLDIGALTIAVRVYDHDELLACELCVGEEDIADVVERWADLASLVVVADESPTTFAPGDVYTDHHVVHLGTPPEPPHPIATTPLPGVGTE
jgi:hypothetical protein